MLKDSTYRDKMTLLQDWFPVIVEAIKKDLKNEHLKRDTSFLKTYFGNGNIPKLTVSELSEGYIKAIESSPDSEAIGEFIANRWLLKNTELYYFFENKLQQVADDFSEIDVLDAEFSRKMMHESISQFGPVKTYLFSVMNSVVFPKEIYTELREQAKNHHEQEKSWEDDLKEKQTIEAKERAFHQQLARLTDKYEKKLLGIEKKYENDVAALKKQISNLQKKLAGQS